MNAEVARELLDEDLNNANLWRHDLLPRRGGAAPRVLDLALTAPQAAWHRQRRWAWRGR